MRAYLRGSISFASLCAPIALGVGMLALGCGGGSNNGGAAGSPGGANPNDPDFSSFDSKRLHVSGNQLVDSSGAAVRLLGVNRAGTEYMCVQQSKVFDGSSGPNSIAAMLTWNINTVRVPLNESCWLGLAGADAHVAPDDYRQEIVDYVYNLHLRGLYAVLDLHWASHNALATKQTTMADAANAPAFWTSVASRFKSDPMVIFDLFNEPILDDSNNNPAGNNDPWGCWLNGCTTREGWEAAGMQQMLTAVRSAGANQVVIATGLNWGGRLDGWLSHKPSDPKNNLMASFHVYNTSYCSNTANCQNNGASVAAQVPVVIGELGEYTCAHSFIDGFMNWADSKGVGYLGWSWNPVDCAKGPALITNVDGTPTVFGQSFKDRFATFGPQH